MTALMSRESIIRGSRVWLWCDDDVTTEVATMAAPKVSMVIASAQGSYAARLFSALTNMTRPHSAVALHPWPQVTDVTPDVVITDSSESVDRPGRYTVMGQRASSDARLEPLFTSSDRDFVIVEAEQAHEAARLAPVFASSSKIWAAFATPDQFDDVIAAGARRLVVRTRGMQACDVLDAISDARAKLVEPWRNETGDTFVA